MGKLTTQLRQTRKHDFSRYWIPTYGYTGIRLLRHLQHLINKVTPRENRGRSPWVGSSCQNTNQCPGYQVFRILDCRGPITILCTITIGCQELKTCQHGKQGMLQLRLEGHFTNACPQQVKHRAHTGKVKFRVCNQDAIGSKRTDTSECTSCTRKSWTWPSQPHHFRITLGGTKYFIHMFPGLYRSCISMDPHSCTGTSTFRAPAYGTCMHDCVPRGWEHGHFPRVGMLMLHRTWVPLKVGMLMVHWTWVPLKVGVCDNPTLLNKARVGLSHFFFWLWRDYPTLLRK